MFGMGWFLVFQTSVAVMEDSMTVNDLPSSTYLSASTKLYPKASDRGTSVLQIGQSILLYLRVLKGDKSSKTENVYTSAFFPSVDHYSSLTVPNTWKLLETFASTDKYANVSMVMYHNAKLFETSWKPWVINDFGNTYHVPFRTLMIVLDQGEYLLL
jgi:hypothetical protein